MPNVKSAEKRLRQNEKRRERNRHAKTTMRSTIKKAEQALESGDAEAARKNVAQACISLDKTASKGIIHKNLASRKKSRLMKQLKKQQGS